MITINFYDNRPPLAVIIERHPIYEIDRLCRDAGIVEPYHMDACAIVGTKVCTIIFPEGRAEDPYLRDLMEHEKRHCREPGWKHGPADM